MENTFLYTNGHKKRIYQMGYLLLCCMLFSINVYSQKVLSDEEKSTVARNVDSLLTAFMKNSTFTQGGENKYNEITASHLMALFTEDAVIFDDIFPKYNDDGIGSPYKLESKKRNDYFRVAYREFASGVRIKNKMIRINYDEINNGKVKVYLNRMLEARSASDGFLITNNDTILLNVRIFPNLNVKIFGIEPIGIALFKVMNDADQDGIINEIDECDDEKGPKLLSGCPDNDKDGIANRYDDCPEFFGYPQFNGCDSGWYSYPFVFSASVGYILALNRIKLPTGGELARPFEKLDEFESMQEAKVTNPGLTGGISFNAHLAYYFGKKKSNLKKGLSLGINISSYEADYSLTNVVLHYKDFDGVDFYRRIVTIDEANERVRFNTINIPIMFRYRFKTSKNVGIEISAGASGMIFFNRFSAAKVLYDAEGVYDFNENLNRFDYMEVFDPIENDYLMLRSEDIDPDDFGTNSSTADAAFNLLYGANRNYDFGLNRELSDNGDFTGIETRYGYAFNGGLDLTYNIFYKVLLKAGANIVVGRNNTSVKEKSYTFITTKKENSEADYHSIFDSDRPSTYIAFGLNIGLIIGLFNK